LIGKSPRDWTHDGRSGATLVGLRLGVWL